MYQLGVEGSVEEDVARVEGTVDRPSSSHSHKTLHHLVGNTHPRGPREGHGPHPCWLSATEPIEEAASSHEVMDQEDSVIKTRSKNGILLKMCL